MPDECRRLLLRAALGFLQLVPREPELRLLHRWLDTWRGVGVLAAMPCSTRPPARPRPPGRRSTWPERAAA